MIKAHDRAQNISLKLGANHGQRGLRVLHQFNGSQRIGGGHVWPRQLDSLNSNRCLANMVKPGCRGISKSLPDYVIKVRVHNASLP